MIVLIMVISLICTLLGGSILLLRIGLLVVSVYGESMAPTLCHGDRILVLRRFLAGPLRKGQIVLLAPLSHGARRDSSALMPTTPLVKRIVGLPYESFEASDDYSEEAAERREHHALSILPRQKRWQIPAGHVFVCGDNLEASVDSRFFGPLPWQQVQGVMLKRLTSEAASLDVQPLMSEEML